MCHFVLYVLYCIVLHRRIVLYCITHVCTYTDNGILVILCMCMCVYVRTSIPLGVG